MVDRWTGPSMCNRFTVNSHFFSLISWWNREHALVAVVERYFAYSDVLGNMLLQAAISVAPNTREF